ncbi:uncharacterized protein [Nerophis lumbriciformis]|uniref:uncharacterized protein isoform X1 n=1 Tax=Nerophis lumbriciformis TaxID=546530 RepID=UPI002ADF723A|nr:gastrula zinc finger protein XlCGF57.1-like isoform X1 [Nerophis lumbriciformis]
MSGDIKPEVRQTQLSCEAKMCEFEKARMLIEQRLNVTAEELFGMLEITVAEYEEELSRTMEENRRLQELLDAVIKPRVLLHRADVQQMSAQSQEIPSEKLEWSPTVGKTEREPPHFQEEDEQFQGLEVQSEESRGAELLTQHITEADGEHCDDVKSEPDGIFAPLSDLNGMMSGSSESDHGDDAQKPSENIKNSKEDTRHHSHGSNLTTHMRTHAGAKLFTCLVCAKRFSLEQNMMLHMRKHIGEKPFACPVCRKRFYTKDCMTTHMGTHVEIKFPSALRPKNSTQKSYVIEHMRTATVEKRFTCSVCRKTFSEKHNMSKHVRAHTEGKKFPCSLCSKTFTYKSNATVHMRTHTGEKPFTCSVCRRSFSTKYNMTKHMTTHKEEKQFSCSICPKRFPQKTSAIAHMRTHRCVTIMEAPRI